MLVVGFQGSPRVGGNTDVLLTAFLDEAESLGATTVKIEAGKVNVAHCVGCRTCEREGFCPYNDDMQWIYRQLRRADVVVLASPIFFYGLTGVIKTIVDRTQALWARRYVLKIDDPGITSRRGLLISVGATKGADLFLGASLEAKYFFDALGASYDGALTFNKIENRGDIEKHPTAIEQVKVKAQEMVRPLLKRKKILYICTENACRSQMACAFTRKLFGKKFEAMSAGSKPAKIVNGVMEEVMAEVGIDMAYISPRSIDDALALMTPDVVVTMGCGDACPVVPGAEIIDWDIPDPAGKSKSVMVEIRDLIERMVSEICE